MQMPWWSEITFRTGNPLNISSHHRSGIAVSSIPVGERVTVNLERKLIPRAAGCQSASKFDPPLECAPGAGQFGELGFQRMKAMARQRSHSIEFKRQVAQETPVGQRVHLTVRRKGVVHNLSVEV